MWGHSTYLDDDGLHVRVSQTRTRRRNRLRYEAAQRLRAEECQQEAQAGDAQNILLGGDALIHSEPVDLGLPEADIDNDDEVPGSGWRCALIDEPYPMDIPLVGGGRGHARYLRFTLDAEGRPTVLGSEGAGRPAYSSRLYARPQPREQHTPNDDSLALYDSHHASRHDIDLALAHLGDPGVCAEVLRYRGSARRKEQLLGQMRDLERRWTDWVGRARGVDRCLKEANVPSRLAAFLPDPLPSLLSRVALNYEPNLDIHIMAHADADDGPLIVPLPTPPAPAPVQPLPPAPPNVVEQPRLAGDEQAYQHPPCAYCASGEHLSFECRQPHGRCIREARCIVPTTHVHRRTYCEWQERVAARPLPVPANEPHSHRYPLRPTPYRRRVSTPARSMPPPRSPPRTPRDSRDTSTTAPQRRPSTARPRPSSPSDTDSDRIDWRRYRSHLD
ncbi:hypothetical protein EDB85DRAFT_1898568 [Lactarius pseudohatsudake]|nr:hypothetical protein EDB85DRAFT_1898568 [Lactarius pseudohatsudake]